MPTFQGWYQLEGYGKLWFDADSMAHAQELLEQVKTGQIEMDELRGYGLKVKGEHLEVDSLEELRY